jgi:hypothetical protein
VTPGAAHAASIASSRSAHERTVPLIVTVPFALVTARALLSHPYGPSVSRGRSLAGRVVVVRKQAAVRVSICIRRCFEVAKVDRTWHRSGRMI